MSDSLYVPKAQYDAMKFRLEESEGAFKRAFNAATNWLEPEVSEDAYSGKDVSREGYTQSYLNDIASIRLGIKLLKK